MDNHTSFFLGITKAPRRLGGGKYLAENNPSLRRGDGWSIEKIMDRLYPAGYIAYNV